MKHELYLEDMFGRTRSRFVDVSPDALVGTFDTLCDLGEHLPCAVIFVDGHGYTSRDDFMDMVVLRNLCSVQAGGEVLFSYPGAYADCAHRDPSLASDAYAEYRT